MPLEVFSSVTRFLLLIRDLGLVYSSCFYFTCYGYSRARKYYFVTNPTIDIVGWEGGGGEGSDVTGEPPRHDPELWDGFQVRECTRIPHHYYYPQTQTQTYPHRQPTHTHTHPQLHTVSLLSLSLALAPSTCSYYVPSVRVSQLSPLSVTCFFFFSFLPPSPRLSSGIRDLPRPTCGYPTCLQGFLRCRIEVRVARVPPQQWEKKY